MPADEGRARDHHGLVADLTVLGALPPRLDRPIVAAVVALVLASAIGAIRLARDGGDVSMFVQAAPPWSDASGTPPGLTVARDGYDGQFYYRLALDPLTDRVSAHGITLDLPAYRQQRIAYPLLAWAASGGGDPARLPLALVVVNVLAIGAIGGIGGALARRAGRHALWGLLFALYPGYVITVSLDLTEAVTGALVLGGLLFLRMGRWAAGAATLTAAVFARETSALVLAAAGVAAFVSAPRDVRRWGAFAIGAATIAAWQVALIVRWSAAATGQGAAALDPPVLGLFAAAWLNAERSPSALLVLWLVVIGCSLALIALGAASLARAAPPGHERSAFYAYTALASVLEANIWANGAVLRALTELGMLSVLIALGAPRPMRHAILATEVVAVLALTVAGGRF